MPKVYLIGTQVNHLQQHHEVYALGRLQKAGILNEKYNPTAMTDFKKRRT
jgi:hypothetical protein